MGKKKKVTIGYWYYFGIHSGVCRGPVDEFVEVAVGGRTAWKGSVTESQQIYIDAPNLFGGEKKEGGIKGTLDIMMGTPTQKASGGLLAMLGGPLPGYRSMLTTFFDGAVAAMNPYPKKWAFRVRRSTKGWQNGAPWYPAMAKVELADGAIHAMNGAHIIYECLTNREWGRGLSPALIDASSFRDAADTMVQEGLGLCLKWGRKDAISTFIQSILDHIGASLYTDRSTGLIRLKLLRHDYLVESLPIYHNDNGLLEISEATISASPNLINQVIVDYVDPVTNEDRSVRVQSIAAMQVAGGAIHTMTKKYPGLPTAELALRAAQRDLRSMSLPLRRFKLVFDRRAWRVAPGDVIRISNPARGLADLVLRVGRVEDGTLTNGRITITAVQDIFAYPLASFVGVEPPRWQPPDNTAKLHRLTLIETPYATLARYMDAADFDYIGFDAGYLGALVEKPSPPSINYDLAVKDGPAAPDEWPE